MPTRYIYISLHSRAKDVAEILKEFEKKLSLNDNQDVGLEVISLTQEIDNIEPQYLQLILNWAVDNNLALITLFPDSEMSADSLNLFANLCLENENLRNSRTQITLSRALSRECAVWEKLDDFTQLQNKIATKQREYHKKVIQNVIQNLTDIPAPMDSPHETATLNVPSEKSTRKKRNQTNALNNLSFDINLNQEEEQEQEQQAEQQADQQAEMQEERQLNLEALQERNIEKPIQQKKNKAAYIDKEKFLKLNVKPFYKDSKTIKEQNEIFWGNITRPSADREKARIVAISGSVAAQLYDDNQSLFKSGFSLDALPPGFILHEDEANPKDLILDYDHEKYQADLKQLEDNHSVQSLYATRRERMGVDIPWEGDERQFKDLPTEVYITYKESFGMFSQEEKINLLISVMRSEDPGFINEEKENRIRKMDILPKIIKNADSHNVLTLINKYGAQGVYCLLNEMNLMDARFDGKATTLTDQFMHLYIIRGRGYVADYDAILKPSALKAVSNLLKLTPQEFKLFIQLSTADQEAPEHNRYVCDRHNHDISLETEVKNFIIFKDELKKLGIDLNITPLALNLKPNQNMTVMMQRILTIVKKSINPIEQFKEIHSLNLDHDTAYQAITEEGYLFVSNEMGFNNNNYNIDHVTIKIAGVDKTSEQEMDNLKSTLSFQPTLSNFFYLADSNSKKFISVDHDYYCQCLFLRLVGKSINAAEYADYRKITKHLSSDELGGQYAIRERHFAIALAAFATIHNNAFKIDSSLFEKVVQKLKVANSEKINHALLSYLKLENKPEVVRPQFNELVSLVNFHTHLGEKHPWNTESHILEKTPQLGKVYFEVIHNHYASRTESDAQASAKNIALIADVLCTDGQLNGNLLSERNNLFKILSYCNFDDLKTTNIETFIETVKDYNPNNLQTALKVLSLIKFKDNTSAHPSFENLTSLLAKTNDLKNPTPNEIMNIIQAEPGFSGCIFDAIKIETYNGDAARNLIRGNLAIIQLALSKPPISLVWNVEYEENTQLLIDKIKELAKDNLIDRVALNIASGKLLEIMRVQINGQLNAAMVAELQPKDLALPDPAIGILAGIFNEKLILPTNVLVLEDSLNALQNYGTQARTLIATLKNLQMRDPRGYTATVQTLKTTLVLNPISLDTLDALFKALVPAYRDNFPNVLFKMIMTHPTLKKMKPEAIDAIFQETLIPNVIRLGLNDSTAKGLMSSVITFLGAGIEAKAMNQLLGRLVRNTDTKDSIIKIIQTIASQSNPNPSNDLIERIDGLIAIAENTPSLKLKFYQKWTNNINELNTIAVLQKKSGLSDKDTQNLLIILSKSACEPKELTGLLKALQDMPTSEKRIEFLSTFGSLSSVPYPNADFLLAAIQSNKTPAESVKEIYTQLEASRNDPKALKIRFGTTEVSRVLENMQNLVQNKGLSFTQKDRLKKQLYTLNHLGNAIPLALDLTNDKSPKKLIKNMEDSEIQGLLKQYREVLSNTNTPPKTKQQTRLIYLALLRESMFRTTGRMPYSTQIIAVLNALNQDGHTLSEIQTGEGKSMISSLKAAMLQAEGDTVHIATMNEELTQAAIEENKPFYDYIGVHSHLMTASTDLSNHVEGGIYYFDVPSLGLLHGEAAIEGFKFPDKVSLILDEADYTLLDDKTQYRYTTNLDPSASNVNMWAFAYPLINEFIDNDNLPDETADNLREYLMTHTDNTQHIRRLQNKALLTDKQLNTWLDSATAAKHLYEKENGRKWSLETETRHHKKASVAKLIINDTPSVVKWSNGIQQFVHARINKEHEKEIKANTFDAAPIDPETKAVASLTSKTVLDFYKKRGKIWGMTGTIGSYTERLEQAAKHGFTLISIPSHKKAQRIMHAPKLIDTDIKQKQAVFNEILRCIRKKEKMPALALCDDPIQAEELFKFIHEKLQNPKYKKYALCLQLASGVKTVQYNDFDAENPTALTTKEAITQASEVGTITISTRMLARGTDFKPKNKKYGLLTIQTYIDTERNTRQAAGRSGRGGEIGESMMMISKEALHRELKKENITFSTSIFKRKKLTTYIKEIQDKRNYTSKEQRQQIEILGDIRNLYFEKMIAALDNNKEGSEKRIEILTQWEALLLDLDLKKAELLNTNTPIDIKAFTFALLRFVDTQWSTQFKGPLLSDSQLHANMHRVLAQADVSKLQADNSESTLALPLETNSAKIACENFPNTSQALIDEATYNELEAIHKNVLKSFKTYKVDKAAYPVLLNDPKQWKEQFTELYIAVQLEFLKAPKGPKKDEYSHLLVQLNKTLKWHTQYAVNANEVSAVNRLILNSNTQLSSKIAERKVAEQQSPYKKAIAFLFKSKPKQKSTESKPADDSKNSDSGPATPPKINK